jgi:site-specific DNA recombinase
MNVYAYTRVSTRKQGELGVSLNEQRDAISAYALKHNLDIVAWFEECVTAAKAGRPAFNEMMRGLRRGKADGVIIHKIDRSARNLRDWTDIGELIDGGVSVHFANESLDLHSRGGRLSADIQAIVAADYIRNLREEIRKGIRGRLKEGLISHGAPLGYLNRGKGKVKEIDPFKGPLVRQAFEMYASGGHTLETIVGELHRRGLRNTRGKPLCLNSLSIILSNPFYSGLIRVKATGETHVGAHQPLISMALFNRVRAQIARKLRTQGWIHEFTFRGLFTCSLCGRRLLGEVQKGHKYYRCHTKGCPTKTFREEVLEAAVLSSWPSIAVGADEREQLLREIDKVRVDDDAGERQRQDGIKAQLANIQERHARLVDAVIDGLVDKASFEQRKAVLLVEERTLQESLAAGPVRAEAIKQLLSELLELASDAQLSYEIGNAVSRRELVQKLCSELTVAGKRVSVRPHFVLQHLVLRDPILRGAGDRETTRTAIAVAMYGSMKDAMTRTFAA